MGLALDTLDTSVKVELVTDIDDLRAEIMRLEEERVFVWQDWLRVLAVLALYNAETRWYDAVRRMNTARHNATSEIWS